VLAAITEYDQLGQDVFLDKYGFHPARSYVLVHDGKRLRLQGDRRRSARLPARPTPAGPRRVSAVVSATVGRLLRRLQFTVAGRLTT